MWEKDKQVLAMYKECVSNFQEEVAENGETEVEWEDVCSVEAGKLTHYTLDMIYAWKSKNEIKISEKK